MYDRPLHCSHAWLLPERGQHAANDARSHARAAPDHANLFPSRNCRTNGATYTFTGLVIWSRD